MAVIKVKCNCDVWDSAHANKYLAGWEYEIDLSDAGQRKLVWIPWLRGKWAFDFDRANSSDPSNHIFFCKECGQPFEKFFELGTHTRESHNKDVAAQRKVQQENEAAEEAKLLAEIAEEERLSRAAILQRKLDEVKAAQVAAQ